jgi:hypothetical protein
MRKPQIQGNDKEYFIDEKGIEIWRFEEDWWFSKEDIPFLKKAIKLLQEKSK